MKRTFKITLILLPLFFLSISTVLAAGYQRINGSTLVEFMGDPTPEIIIDVREPELFARGHIPGAINIEYRDAKKTGLDSITENREARIIFVCHGGPMGDKLSKKLVARGYINVYNLIGGMRRWDGPVTK